MTLGPVAQRLQLAHHDLAHRLLEPRRTRRIGEFAEQPLDAVACGAGRQRLQR
jgi:hypothetical protein